MEENNILTSLAQCKDLINCDVVSTQLNTILTGLCDVISEQHIEIRNLKRELAAKDNDSDKIEAAVEAQNEELAKSIQIEMTKIRDDFVSEIAKLSDEATELKKALDKVTKTQASMIQNLEEDSARQFRGLSLELAQYRGSWKETVDEIRESHQNVLKEMADTRAEVASVDFAQVDVLKDKVKKLEQKLGSTDLRLEEKHQRAQKMFAQCNQVSSEIKKSFDGEVFSLQQRLTRLERDAGEMPELRDMLLQGDEIGLTQILKNVMRDTRRLDFFDEQVSSIRNECQNVATAVENVHQIVQKFNHEIYDHGIEIQKNSSHFKNEIGRMKSVISDIGKLVSDNLTSICKVGEVGTNTASACSFAFDEVVHLMTVISGRSFANVHSLDEVTLAFRDLMQGIRDTRNSVDMSVLLRRLEGDDIDINPAAHPINIPEFQRKMRPVNLNPTEPATDFLAQENSRDPMMLMTLEELRVRMTTLEESMGGYTGKLGQMLDGMKKNIDKKLDVEEMDRIVAKLQTTMAKIKHSSTVRESIPITAPVISMQTVQQQQWNDASSLCISARPEDGVASSARAVKMKDGILKSLPRPVNPIALKSARMQGEKVSSEARKSNVQNPQMSRPRTASPGKTNSEKLASQKVHGPHV